MRAKLTIGTRGSRLALIQAEYIAARLKEANPGLETGIIKITTAGDRDRITGLDQIGINVFVKELEEALLDNRIDLAVHSLKDVPTELPQGLVLLASTEREDPRDAIVAKATLDKLPSGARVATGSLRRSIQLAQYRTDLELCGIRGNVDTRLRKVADGEFAGVIVAAAAMSRLGWSERVTEYLPMDRFLPAVGQGALVIEGRFADRNIAEMVSPLNHLPTWQSVTAERAFLLTLGGGCRAPIAALGTVKNGTLKLEGMVASVSTRRMLRAAEEGPAASPVELGKRLADRLLEMGATEFIAEVRGN